MHQYNTIVRTYYTALRRLYVVHAIKSSNRNAAISFFDRHANELHKEAIAMEEATLVSGIGIVSLEHAAASLSSQGGTWR